MTTKWQCPQYHREFAKINQSHSCKEYLLENHFQKKEYAKDLFDDLVTKIETQIGPVKIESLTCCIYLISFYTFSGVWAKRDKLTIDFRVSEQLESPRFSKKHQMSANRFLYYLDINTSEEIDEELLGWLKRSYALE